jgi:hypothetical protein
MTRFSTFRCVSIAASGVLCLLGWLQTPTVSADIKSFNASTCQTASSAFDFLTHGVIENVTPIAQGVACPILRDTVFSGASPDWLDMWVLDRNPSHGSYYDVRCTFRSSEADGTVVTQETKSSTGGSGNLQYLYWEEPDSVPLGYYHFMCIVPGVSMFQEASQIVSYRIEEQ